MGPSPSRQPPSAEAVGRLRAAVAAAWGLAPEEAELRHPHSPWRYRLVARLIELSMDPDVVLSEWLQHGAPVGIARAIPPGNLFPRAEPDKAVTELE
eukprot:915857-Lingulodinium_polyedra.AAC.1